MLKCETLLSLTHFEGVTFDPFLHATWITRFWSVSAGGGALILWVHQSSDIYVTPTSECKHIQHSSNKQTAIQSREQTNNLSSAITWLGIAPFWPALTAKQWSGCNCIVRFIPCFRSGTSLLLVPNNKHWTISTDLKVWLSRPYLTLLALGNQAPLIEPCLCWS